MASKTSVDPPLFGVVVVLVEQQGFQRAGDEAVIFELRQAGYGGAGLCGWDVAGGASGGGGY